MPDIRPLSDTLQAKAIAELHEVPSRLDEDIAALSTWIEKQPHLNARASDQFLVAFLRGCKFSLEKAKDKIEKYFSLRTVYESVLTCRNVEDPRVREISELGVSLILPKTLGEGGPRIMITRAGGYSTDKFTLPEIMRVNAAVQDILLQEDDNVVVSGYVAIMDCANITKSHFLQINPSFMKKFSVFTEEALPLRHQASYFINTPSGFEAIFNMLKPFIPSKMQERITICGSNLEGLYKVVPQKYLPVEYGGENGSVQEIIDYWTNNLLDHAAFFKDDAQYRTNEALRVGKPLDYDNVFGVEGSFRKLEFD